MNKTKIRIGSKVEEPLPAQTALSCKENSTSQALINGVSNDRLCGFEDIAQFDSSGVPFLLVDGINVRTRQQLHSALAKREKKCMKDVQRQCCVLPWLEYQRPVPETEPLTMEEKEAQEELDFQADLQLLQLRVEGTSLPSGMTGLDTPIAHAASTEDLLPNISRIEQIRIQLEKLRELQQNDPVDPLALSEQLGIRREATFDIERDEPIDSLSSSSSSLNSPNEFQLSMETQQRLVRATTISQLPRIERRPSFKKMHTSTYLSKKRASNITLGSKDCRPETSKAPGAPLVNRIGDLLMQIPEKRMKSDSSDGSYAYVVTVAPKAKALTFPIASRCVSEKYKRDSKIAIIAAPLQTKSQTFLKAPTLFKKGKK